MSRIRFDRRTVWFFDLDNTLHDAGQVVFPQLNQAMTDYIHQHLAMPRGEADQLRVRYWLDYGSTLLGLMRHHRVAPAHFLHETHRLPDLEAQLRGHRHDLRLLRRLPGRRVLLTNAPRAYAHRVLRTLRIEDVFDAVLAIEDMRLFGQLRPKPDARLFRTLPVRLKVAPQRCVLVEDTLDHQKSAHRCGWQTVWMQRWLHPRAAAPLSPLRRRLPYVDCRVRSLRALCQNR